MAIYNFPGVYIQEYLNPISQILAAPGSSTAAFVGAASGGGPIGPILISSWAQYQALYGGIGTTDDDLGYAVFTYFANGGGPCYVLRAVNADATAAALTINDTEGSPQSTLTVTATAPGTWASAASSTSRVFITVTPTATGRFDFVVEVGSGNALLAREQFSDVTLDPTDGRYAVQIVNSSVVGSKYVKLTSLLGAYAANHNPASTTKAPLTGGTDGTGSPNVGTTVPALETLDQDLVVNLPAASSSDVGAAVTWAEGIGRHFVVADVPKPAANETAAASVTAQTSFVSACPVSSYLAVYGPWLYIVDPGSTGGATRITAPGGAVVGQYMRTDALAGVQKAPAGIQTTLQPVIGPYLDYTEAQSETLFGANSNVLRRIPGSETVIWGARTTKAGFPDRFVPVRRLLISIKSSLVALTRFAVFDNNDEGLRALLTDVCTTFLGGLVSNGALKGSTNQEAFYVTCNDTNNTAQTVAAGEVHIEVGVALETPAEFIVIRLGQTEGGASTSDSLEIA